MTPKKILALLLAIIMLFSLVACNGSEDPLVPDNDDSSDSDNINNTEDTQDTKDDAESTEDSSNESAEDSESTDDKIDEPDDDKELVYPWAEVPKTLKVLAIGNSFSVDAMEYLYNIAKSAGVETIVLGNLRVSGCTVDMHTDYALSNKPKYTYLKNTSESWISTDNYTFEAGLTDEAWDFITLQQGSHFSGMPSEYRQLGRLISIVNNKKTNPEAKLFWHMTWAYQQSTSNQNFALYNNSQSEMYNAIVSTVQSTIIPTEKFEGIIPSGTTVQNIRTSFIGDNVNRDDGYHMSQPFGRYLIGLTYFAAITGADVSKVTYLPSASITKDMEAAAKESVKNAMLNMFSVTESEIKETTEKEENTEQNDSKDPADLLQSDKELAQRLGIDLSKYTLLEYEYLTNMYYKSTSNIKPNSASSSQNEKHICFKERYTKEQLLNAVIICDAGWQYRPERWDTESEKASSRPGMCSEPIVLLDEAYWGNNIYFALNISANPQRSLAADYSEAALHVRIYVPTK